MELGALSSPTQEHSWYIERGADIRRIHYHRFPHHFCSQGPRGHQGFAEHPTYVRPCAQGFTCILLALEPHKHSREKDCYCPSLVRRARLREVDTHSGRTVSSLHCQDSHLTPLSDIRSMRTVTPKTGKYRVWVPRGTASQG